MSDGERRKRIAFDAETWHALNLLTRDRGATLQELADEAFRDLLRKHRRPVGLRNALRDSRSASHPSSGYGGFGRAARIANLVAPCGLHRCRDKATARANLLGLPLFGHSHHIAPRVARSPVLIALTVAIFTVVNIAWFLLIVFETRRCPQSIRPILRSAEEKLKNTPQPDFIST
jgi:hypothetical protein